jgi:3-hydroxybutyryl-CoA dehydrogenase
MKREMEYLYKELTEENKLHAPVLLKSMIRAEKLGKKVGQGWYKY